MSSLTTCDELREAKSEIKRVPENSRGSARSNYLYEARGPTVESTFFLRLFFISRLDQLSPSHFLRRAIRTRDGATGSRRAKGIIFGLLFAPRLQLPRAATGAEEERRRKEDNETWNSRNSIRRINFLEDPRGMRRTAGRNLISLANEFLSKSRVSRLM